jgi:hypothetical protein
MNDSLGGVNPNLGWLCVHFDCLQYFPITWLVQGENRPPLSYWQAWSPCKLSPEHCIISTQKRCHVDLWLGWLVVTHHHNFHRHQFPLHLNPTRERVSWLLFRLSLCLLFPLDFLAVSGCFPTLIWASSENVFWVSLHPWTSLLPGYHKNHFIWVDLSLIVLFELVLRLLASHNND